MPKHTGKRRNLFLRQGAISHTVQTVRAFVAGALVNTKRPGGKKMRHGLCTLHSQGGKKVLIHNDKKNAMEQEVITYAGMHADHRHWHRENSMWRDDIGQWRTQHELALSQLARLEKIIRQHGEALDAHADAIERVEHSLKEHEKGMAAYQREGAGAEVQEPMVKNHRQQAERHARQREAHERIKKHHHTVMAHLTMLKTAIEAAV